MGGSKLGCHSGGNGTACREGWHCCGDAGICCIDEFICSFDNCYNLRGLYGPIVIIVMSLCVAISFLIYEIRSSSNGGKKKLKHVDDPVKRDNYEDLYKGAKDYGHDDESLFMEHI